MSVPQLRFKEFSQPWFDVTIGDIGEIITGNTPSTAESAYYNGNRLFVSPTDISGERYISNTKTTLSEAGFEKGRLVKANSILFVCIGSTIGKLAQNKVDCVTNQQINSIIPFKTYHSGFIYSRLEKDAKKISLLAGEQAVPLINKTSFSKIPINVPTLPEQTKIASFLTAVDEKITQLTQKCELLTQYKKGVMQQIFSQALRFKDDEGREFPEWRQSHLGDLCSITTGKLDANAMVENGQYRFYTCAKEHYQIDRYAFDTDALLISGNGANVGYIHHYKGKFNAYQRTYVLDGFGQNIIFVKYFLDAHLHARIFTEKKEGNTPYIVMGTLADMEIKFPSIIEQTKIANFLTAIDDKIANAQAQLAAAKQYKQGLLQQMFV